MIREAVDCEAAFAQDVLALGVVGLSPLELREYLEYVANRRLESLGIAGVFGARNPFAFMELQDVQELANFFERRGLGLPGGRDGRRRLRRGILIQRHLEVQAGALLPLF